MVLVIHQCQVPNPIAAVFVHVLCTPYNHTPVYNVTSCKTIYVECVCLAVTCHLEDHRSHSSDGQAEQDVEKQHQLPNQIPALQVADCLHPALRMWGMDSAGRWQEKNPGIQDEVPGESFPHLVQRTQDHCVELGQEPHGSPRTSPGNHQAVEAGVVWPCHEACHPLQNHHARHRWGRMQRPETMKAGPTTSRTGWRWPSGLLLLPSGPPQWLQKSRDWMSECEGISK